LARKFNVLDAHDVSVGAEAEQLLALVGMAFALVRDVVDEYDCGARLVRILDATRVLNRVEMVLCPGARLPVRTDDGVVPMISPARAS